MKLLLIWPTPAPEIRVLMDALAKEDHEILYWAGYRSIKDLTPRGAIFHDHYDALAARPADEWKEKRIDPLSADEIQKHAKLELLILSMMDKHFDASPVDERKHVFYQMLSYWTKVFDELNPDAVVYGNMPHSIYTSVVYEIALERGIPTICFEDPWAWVPGHTLLYRNFWNGSDELRTALKRLQGGQLSIESLQPLTQEYWERNVERREQKTTAAMVSQKRTAVGWGMVRNRAKVAMATLRKGTFVKAARGYLRRHIGANLPKEYASVVRSPDWNKRFVYYPLHFQPERATSPLGGVYHDQILAAETFAAALPSGWELNIKEHPSQWWLRDRERYNSARYPGYYKRLAGIPNVRLVPVSTNTFDLIERSQAVVGLTGTAGWEALMRGKCTVVLGFPWYRDCPGVFRASSVEECADAFRSIAKGACVNKRDLLAYFKALEEASVPAYVDLIFVEKPFSLEENMRRLGQAICSELKRAAVSV